MRPPRLATQIRRAYLPMLGPLRARTVRKIEQEPAEQRFAHYQGLSDKAWLRVLLDSVDGRAALPMPRFPSAERQVAFIASSNAAAIREAWKFYILMASERKKYELILGPDSHVLDFGCGWGRFSRMFLRDVPEEHIWCADSMELALDTCRETGVPGRMIRMSEMPPSDLPSSQFDTICAYSVFSHFSPYAHAGWEGEFARVMKPSGLAFVTTQGRWFLNRCRTLREDPVKVTTPWEASLARSFVDYEDAIHRYESGEFLYAPNGGASEPSEIYGDAVVPRAYFEAQWSEHFELLDFIANPTICPQAVAVLRRREAGP